MANNGRGIWLAAGVRTPFEAVDGPFAHRDSLALSVPVVQAMSAQVEGGVDFAIWGSVVLNLAYANLAREVWLEAKLDPHGPAFGQNIIDQWSQVQVPPPPELKKVTIEPKTTALLVMGFVKGSCNAERRPRCVATIPHVKKLLTEARAHGVLVMHSVPCGSASSDLIVADLAPLPGEAIIPPNGPNKFLPFDVLCSHSDIGFDLEKLLKDHGIKTVITAGTQVQTAVLHTAAEAALRGYKVIVPIDGMSGNSLYPEQYTAWHLVNTERVMQQVTLTKVDLVGY